MMVRGLVAEESAVMAAGGAVQRFAADSPHENEEMSRSEAAALHERLVAYVHSLAQGSRRGVWGEHSYARSRIEGAGGAGRVRVLLAPRAPSPAPDGRADLDVTGAPEPPPSPPEPRARPAPPDHGDDDDDDDGAEDDWEARVAALAPSPAHAQLAAAAADALRRMRLERLVRGGRAARREQARAAARRLRRALAPLWAAGGSAPAPAWLHAALAAHLPRGARRLYEEAAGELRRSVPRLAERMTGAWAPPPPEPSARAAAPVGPESSPWLVWVSSGRAALDARWERRLAALVHTRVLRGAGGARGAEAAAPEPWCAAAAGAVRAALTDALAEAGERSVVLGGVGAGAAVALVLARGAGAAGGAGGVRGCVLAAPALLTAEGARDARDDALAAVRLPLLLLVGSAAADAPRSVANNVCEGYPSRRLLEVRGADSELRLPRRLRTRHALPQHALDAALVEECVRWAVETAEQEEPAAASPPAPAPPAERRRPRLPSVVREIDLCSDEEYSHLSPAPPAAAAPAPAPRPPAAAGASPSQSARVLEMTEGRAISRVTGGTPLTLLPPRRGAGGGAPAGGGALAAADIMQLPIVFADDERTLAPAPASGNTPGAVTESSSGGSPVTVTSGKPKRDAPDGSVKFTRVILAKRGAHGAGAGPGAGAARGAGAAPRRLLLRRGVRLVPRTT